MNVDKLFDEIFSPIETKKHNASDQMNEAIKKYGEQNVKVCHCCNLWKPIKYSFEDKFKSNCQDCEFRARCRTCDTVRDRKRFYENSWGKINNCKCKDCYIAEHKVKKTQSLI
jgi:hypothetical protein